jgi:hypothetical protein
MRVQFSAPVSAAQVRAMRLTGGGKTYAPAIERGGKGGVPAGCHLQAGPFPVQASLVLTLPPNLKDDAGRACSTARAFP